MSGVAIYLLPLETVLSLERVMPLKVVLPLGKVHVVVGLLKMRSNGPMGVVNHISL